MTSSLEPRPRSRVGARLSRIAALGAAAALAGALLAIPLPALADDGAEGGCTFAAGVCEVAGQPGSQQEIVIPSGVSRITALVIGGAGGANSTGTVPGGQGGMTMATFDVTAGQKLDIVLGGGANGATPGTGYSAGGQGGASPDTPGFMPTGGGGGGSSAVLDGTTGEVIAVAGGGGGAGGDALGGGAPGGAGGDGGQPASSGGNGWPTATATDGAPGGEGGGADQADGEDNATILIGPTSGAGGGGYSDGGAGGGGASGWMGTPDGTEDYPSAGGGGGGASYVAPSAVTWRFLSSGPWNSAGDGTVLLYTSSGSVFTCASGTQDLVLPGDATGAMVVTAGGAGQSTEDNGQGGGGAIVTGQFSVAGGTQLQVEVGCAGDDGGYGWSSGGAGGRAHDLTRDGGVGGGSSAVVITGQGTPTVGAGGGGGAGGPIFDAACNCSGGNGGQGFDTPVAAGIGGAGAGGDGGGLFGGDGGLGGWANGAGGDDGENGAFLEAPGGGGGGGIVNGGSYGRRGGASSAGGGGGAGSSYAAPGTSFVTGGTLDPGIDGGIVLIIPVQPLQLASTLTIDQPVVNAVGSAPDVRVGVTCTVGGGVVTSEVLRFTGDQRTLAVGGIPRGATCIAQILDPADAGADGPITIVMDVDKRISLAYDASKARAAVAAGGSARLADTGAAPTGAVGLVALLIGAGAGALALRRRFVPEGR